MSLGPTLAARSVYPLSLSLRLQFQCPRKNSHYSEPPWLHNSVKNMTCPCASPRSASSCTVLSFHLPSEKIGICRGVDVRNTATKDAPEVTEWALITVSWTLESQGIQDFHPFTGADTVVKGSDQHTKGLGYQLWWPVQNTTQWLRSTKCLMSAINGMVFYYRAGM